MPRTVPPGGRYFWMNGRGRVSDGRRIAFASAATAAAASTTRDVIDFRIPDDLSTSSWPREGPPFLLNRGPSAFDDFIGMQLSYDTGYWDDHPGYSGMGGASKFLVALYGDGACDVGVEKGATVRIAHYISGDGGQYINLSGPPDRDLDARITRIVIWRVEGDPPEPSDFWTSFVGSREII